MKKFIILPVLGIFLLAGCGIATDKKVDEVNESASAPILEMAIADGGYQIDTENSVVTWSGSKLAGGTHTGVIDIKSGSFVMIGEKFGGGNVVMDMMTIKSDEELGELEGHLAGEEFFNVETYPESTLMLQTIMPTSEKYMYQVGGDLTIKDVTNRIDFVAKIVSNNGELRITSDFEIERAQWGIVWGDGNVLDAIKDKVLNDEIKYHLDILAKI